jgi:hypothetical protein
MVSVPDAGTESVWAVIHRCLAQTKVTTTAKSR